MKNLPLLIGSLLFSTLFYDQNIGLNLSLFSLLTILVLANYNRKAFKQKSVLAYTFIYLITATSIFLFQSSLAIIANCIAFLTLIGHVSERGSSIYVNWLNGIYTTIAGYFHKILNKPKTEENTQHKKDIDYLHLVKIIGIPLMIVLVFIGFYSNGNPLFHDFISKINFDFINLKWILFSALGYFLLINISTPIKVNPATENDLKIGNFLKNKKNISEENLKKENQLALILMVMLNTLIILFLITDIVYLVEIKDLNAAELSNQVHSGIYALIASIIMAIIIILYFFRGDLNFYKCNQTLKNLTYVWITLNLILVFSIVVKNYQYISSFGFTYKRIGVFVYLLLTLVGLLTTAKKVYNVKNLWYLFRVNSQIAFAILIISCAFNWDALITKYNLNYAATADFDYLVNLSNNNSFILKTYGDGIYSKGQSKYLADKKLKEYTSSLNERNWQEWSFDNLKIKSK
ncbi:DUF4153 domain-containing protein [Algibacter sp. L1A34]|uniref:DUF4153 domain-containing protein n=1 Tax=Algibacter sp. L1A34 TaxID=2686365 RepID=UPI00131E837A|nr:DUF4153 domain-containing protein [Algibacter sp. L1A34]